MASAEYAFAFEHERRQPIRGWGSDFPGFMLPTDRRGWLDMRGQPTPYHPGKEETAEEKAQWLGDWEVCKNEACDEDGWVYAADFPLIEQHHSNKPGVNVVRRRRWQRQRRPAGGGADGAINVDARISGFPRGQHVKGHCCWSEPDSTTFSLRGATYMSDKLKIASLPAIMTLVHVDLFAASTRIDHLCDKPDGFVAIQRRKGDNRFMLCVNFQAPPHHMAVYFAIPENAHESWDAVSQRLWKAFVNGSDEFRNSRWKVIPTVVEGPWVIKKSVGAKPALLGTKLVHTYIHKEDEYLELDCNIYSSTTATWLVELLKGYATAFSIDIGFVIQGNEPQELPERALGAVRFSRPDLTKARPVAWSGAASVQPVGQAPAEEDDDKD